MVFVGCMPWSFVLGFHSLYCVRSVGGWFMAVHDNATKMHFINSQVHSVRMCDC